MPIVIQAQSDQQREALLHMAETRSQQYADQKAEALQIAGVQGLRVRLELGNGQVAELMRFERGLPMYYITQNANGAFVIKSDRVYPGGDAGLTLTGAGQTLGIWDAGKVRSTHQELTGRVTQQDDASSNDSHATHVAGTMVAAGTDPAARGMSFQASLHAYDWGNDVSEMAAAAAGGLKVSQHSYGYITGWAYGSWSGYEGWHWFGDPGVSQTEDYYYGFYSQPARSWDDVAWNAPNYLIVKSAGNDRGKGPAAGTLHYVFQNNQWTESTTTRQVNGGSSGYDCLSHSSLSKNALSVGAVTSAGVMTSFSSWGPTDDGRIKPDIVAKGSSVYSSTASSNSSYGSWAGTSMSGPMVSGSVGLLLQHQENLHPGQAMLSSTMKALILHSADDMVSGAPGPDYRFGWGMMNTAEAIAIMSENVANGGIHIQELSINNGGSVSIPVRAKGNEPLRATIVWTDVPGTPPPPSLNPTTPALVNDLDMRLTDASNNIFLPYILDPANPSLAASTGNNFRDNVEMIHVTEPGVNKLYELTINHKGSLSGGSQPFSLVISGNQAVSGVFNPQSFVASADSPSQIELSWTKNDNGHDVMVVWSASSTFGQPQDGTSYQAGQTLPGGGTVLYRGSNTSLLHTGLSQDMTYHYKAFSYDSGNTYSAGLLASTTTPCNTITVYPYLEDFNASVNTPTCWRITDHLGNGQVWQFGAHGNGLSGTTGNYAYLDSDAYGSGSSQNTDLVSPMFDMTDYTDVSLSFKHYFQQYESSSVATLSYSTDNGNTWTQLSQWTATTSNPASYSQVIPQLSGQSEVRFKWNYTGSWSWWWDVDDISVAATLYVPPPVYTLTYLAGDNGSIDGQATQSVVHGDDGTQVEAIPDNGYYFDGWSDGHSGNPRTDTDVTESKTVTASFDILTYTLTYLAGDNGSIDGQATQSVVHGDDGTQVEAIPDNGYYFDGWSDGHSGNPRTDTQVTLDITVTAMYNPIEVSTDHVVLQGITLAPGEVVCYSALKTITLAGEEGGFIASASSQLTLIAGESTRMLPGTHLIAGSQVRAWIAPEGPFCGEPDKLMVAVDAEAEIMTNQSEDTNEHDGALLQADRLFRVYPNPTAGRFALELYHLEPTAETTIEVYGLRGERVLRKELPSGLYLHELNLEGMVPGIYIIRVVSGVYVGVERIIKR